MGLKHITFTGIDAMTDFKVLQEIQKEYPIAEFGVLTSYHWYENGNRYLAPNIIDTLRGKGLQLSLHVCGSAARDAALGQWLTIDKLVWGNLDLFKRIQLNIAGRKDNPDICWIPQVIGQELIVQQRNSEDMLVYKATLRYWTEAPYPYRFPISVLLDASGGRGIDTPINVLRSHRKVGYAGGFGPDNVADKLSFLMENVKTGEFWIDMESGVRTNDWFDLDKVVKVLEICQPIINQYQEGAE